MHLEPKTDINNGQLSVSCENECGEQAPTSNWRSIEAASLSRKAWNMKIWIRRLEVDPEIGILFTELCIHAVTSA